MAKRKVERAIPEKTVIRFFEILACIMIFVFFSCGSMPPKYVPLQDIVEKPDQQDGASADNNGDENTKDQNSNATSSTSDQNAQSGDSEESDAEEGDGFEEPAYLHINEIYYDAEGSDTNGDVFIELYGEPLKCIGGYHVALINGDDGKIYKTIPIDGDYETGESGLFVIADVDSNNQTNVLNAGLLANFDPQNGPDSIQLIDRDGGLVDVVGYGDIKIEIAENGYPLFETSPAEDASSGSSLSRIPGTEDMNDNSIDFAVFEPSPGTM